MARITFDIAAVHDPAQWLHSHLVMEISQHIFSYAVISQEKKLVQLRFYEMDARYNHELAEELEGIIHTDEIIKTAVDKKTFVYNFSESQLVPEQYFNTDGSKDLIELLHGDLNTGITLSEKVQGGEYYNIYQVPAEIHNLFQQNFGDSKYWHYYSLWPAAEQQQEDRPASYLSVLFYPNRILASVVKDNQLHLLQSYSYEAAEDVAYYLLNVCRQLQLPPENVPVILSGMIDVSSVLYTEIYKYFGQLSLAQFSIVSSNPALDGYPPHFFSPLMKMALCVS
ncbi:MAG: DUF3822 family protein [Bacteroidota bacterium]